jgi:hypothetical protein
MIIIFPLAVVGLVPEPDREAGSGTTQPYAEIRETRWKEALAALQHIMEFVDKRLKQS